MGFYIRDGKITQDRRLDRIEQFDSRSISLYGAADLEVIDESLPIGNKVWPCGPSMNQGTEGACVGFGFAHFIQCGPVQGRADEKAARERIYWETQKRDIWPGGAYPGARPRYEGTSVLAAAQYLHSIGVFSSYLWLKGAEQVGRAIEQVGPVVIGVPWKEDMFDTDEEGFIHFAGRTQGGHCTMLYGVHGSGRRRYIIGKNSWGPRWGVNGGFRISFEDLDEALHENGEACLPVGEQYVDLVSVRKLPWWKRIFGSGDMEDPGPGLFDSVSRAH